MLVGEKSKMGIEEQEKNFEEVNKDYYRHIEDYDWVNVVDSWKGIEAIFHRMRVKTTLNLIQRYARSGKFLDAGTGTGLILRCLPEDSIGIDINPRNIAKARQHVPKADLRLCDIDNMPFEDGTFANIVCTEVIEHLMPRERALQEMKRVLKPDGILIGSVPARTFLWKLRFMSSTCPVEEPIHYNFTRDEIYSILNTYFKIIMLRRANIGMNWVFICRKMP
jgi:SAM-dependent methyltransferase